MDPQILELCRQPPHFAYEAYEFICDAVTFTQHRLGRDQESDDQMDRHVSGAELLRGVCDLAIREFGMMAPVVFRQWGIRTTDDVGKIVFDLIEVGRLSKSERDAPEDFHDLFDLHQALHDGFAFSIEEVRSAKRSER